MAGCFPFSVLLKRKRNPGIKSQCLEFKYLVIKMSEIKIEEEVLQCLKFRDKIRKIWFCLRGFY